MIRLSSINESTFLLYSQEVQYGPLFVSPIFVLEETEALEENLRCLIVQHFSHVTNGAGVASPKQFALLMDVLLLASCRLRGVRTFFVYAVSWWRKQVQLGIDFSSPNYSVIS